MFNPNRPGIALLRSLSDYISGIIPHLDDQNHPILFTVKFFLIPLVNSWKLHLLESSQTGKNLSLALAVLIADKFHDLVRKIRTDKVTNQEEIGKYLSIEATIEAARTGLKSLISPPSGPAR